MNSNLRKKIIDPQIKNEQDLKMIFRQSKLQNQYYMKKLKLQITSSRQKQQYKSKIKHNHQISDSNIRSFRKQFSERKSKDNKIANNIIKKHKKNSNKILSLQSDRNYQQNQFTSDFENQQQPIQKNKCRIILIHKNKKIYYDYKIQKIADLITFLNQYHQNIVAFTTIPSNLLLDFYLTQYERDGSFLNGKSICLTPFFKISSQKITINSFQIIRCIGAGGFSKVFLVRFNQDGKFYAMKLIQKKFIIENKKKGIVQNQRSIMQQINHPFLIQMKFSFQSADYIIFVLQYCPGGQLFNLVKKFKKMPQQMAKFYIIQILLGLQYLHSKSIIYRDIKPENILITLDGHIKIADFGLAKPNIDKQSKAYSFCGSPQYMAPEMIMKIGHSFPVDFYCLGALLYQLVTGLPPFYSKQTQQIYESVLTEEIYFPKHCQNLSGQCKNLIKSLLNKRQKQRLGSLFGVKQILAHPWFGKLKRSDYQSKKIIPPVKIDNIDTLNFDFSHIRQNNNKQLVQSIFSQQKQQKNCFKKIFKNFNYDYRISPTPQYKYDLNEVLSNQNFLSPRKFKSPLKDIINIRNDQEPKKLKKMRSTISKLNITNFLGGSKIRKTINLKSPEKSPYNIAF